MHSSDPVGWVALDNLAAVDDPDCKVIPAEAQMTTIAPETSSQPPQTTLPPPHFPNCDFNEDMCDWSQVQVQLISIIT